MSDQPTTRGYFVDVRDGTRWAVELKDGWIPQRAAGPLQPTGLARELADVDFANAVDASKWNVAHLVPIDDRERERIASGRTRATRVAGRSAPVTRQVSLTERPETREVREWVEGETRNP